MISLPARSLSTRRRAFGRRLTSGHIGDQVSAARTGPAIRGGQRGEQSRGIIVEAVEWHQGHAAMLTWAHSARRVDIP